MLSDKSTDPLAEKNVAPSADEVGSFAKGVQLM